MGSLTWWISNWQVILLNFSLLVLIKNYFYHSLTVFWYMHLVFLISVTQLEIGFALFLISFTIIYISKFTSVLTMSLWITVLLVFISSFRGSHCIIQALENILLQSCYFFVFPKILSADSLNPRQMLYQVGFWRLHGLMCIQTQWRLLSRDWYLMQSKGVMAGGGGRLRKSCFTHPEALKHL